MFIHTSVGRLRVKTDNLVGCAEVEAEVVDTILRIVAHVDVTELIEQSQPCVLLTGWVHVHEVSRRSIRYYDALVGGVLEYIR